MTGRRLSRRQLLRLGGWSAIYPSIAALDRAHARQPGIRVTVRQVTRAAFPRIGVFASVRSASGGTITGLSVDDVSVTEGGNTQAVRSVAATDADGRAPVSVALAIDRSGSMDDAIGDARAAAQRFVGRLGAGDEAQVIAFADAVTIRQRWTSDAERLRAAIESIRTGGDTALWAAAVTAVERAATRPGRSAVVVLTDGRNNRPPDSASAPIDAARSAGVTVYTVGLGQSIDASALRRLAEATDGAYFETPDSEDLVGIYDRIARSIATEYRIDYRTSDAATDGTRRTVEVTVRHRGDSGSGAGHYVAPCAPIPEAAIGHAPDDPVAGQQIAFDASASSPNGGRIASYEWDFDGDGAVDATGERAAHTFASPGSYEVRLTVTKPCGVSDVALESIDVTDRSDGKPRPDGERHTLTIAADGPVEYAVTTAGAIEPATLSGDFSADGDERFTDDPGGTRTVSDDTGPSPINAGPLTYLGDRFLIDGEIDDLRVEPTDPDTDVKLYVDERRASRPDLVRTVNASSEARAIMITANGQTDYSLTVDGRVEAQEASGDFSAEGDEQITDGHDGTRTASGETGPTPDRAGPAVYFGDRFVLTRPITELELSPAAGTDVNLYLDGRRVSKAALLAPAPN